MQHTTNYDLNQWDADDRVTRADFNADNAKIDAALAAAGGSNCKIVMGSYTGNGGHGSSAPTSLSFSNRPLFVVLHAQNAFGAPRVILVRDAAATSPLISSDSAVRITWTDHGVTWYAEASANNQCNIKNNVYIYLALLQADA